MNNTKRKFTYPAVFTPPDGQNEYVVLFPDFGGAAAFGKDFYTAYENAKRVLQFQLYELIERGIPLPHGSNIADVDIKTKGTIVSYLLVEV